MSTITSVKGTRTNNSIKNFIAGFAGQMVNVLLKFISRTVFIYILGKSYLGINGLFSDILSMLSIAELGFDTAINYKFYKPLAENDVERIKSLVCFYKKIYRMVGTVFILLGICIIPWLRYLIKDYESIEALNINVILIFMLYVFQSASSYLFFAYKSAVIKAAQKEFILNIAEIFVTFVTCIAQIITLLIWKNFILYTIVGLSTNILKNLFNAFIAQKCFPQYFLPGAKKLEQEEIRSIFKDCGAMMIYKMNAVVLKATDNLVLSSFIGIELVGIYSNYLLIYKTVQGLISKFYNAVKAGTGDLFAVSNVEKKYSFFEVMNLLTMILYGTAAIEIAVVSNELIEWWIGDEYIIGSGFTILIAIELILYGMKINLGQIRNTAGLFIQGWFRPIISIIINIVISIILVQIIGIHGVIIGTISADLCSNCIFDPPIIYKYAFDNYKPVYEFYKKNILYIITLVLIGIFEGKLCSMIQTPNDLANIIIHTLLCCIGTPVIIVIIFNKTIECKYIVKKISFIIKSRFGR